MSLQGLFVVLKPSALFECPATTPGERDKSSTMHPCLDILDIQHIVFPMCAEEHSHRTLAALARTCSQFYGSAMDALWYKLDGLGPLMHSMPPHILCEQIRPSPWTGYSEETELHFAREPLPHEWDGMFKHAHRIRDLNLGLSFPRWCKATVYSDNVLPLILWQMRTRLQSPVSGPIFPNLITLRCLWNPALDILSDCMPRLVNPNIRALRIYGSASQNSRDFPAINRFLATLNNSYTCVEDFSALSGFAAQDIFTRCSMELSGLVLSLPCLRLFRSNIVVDQRAISHLSSMASLTSLILRIPEVRLRDLEADATLDSLLYVNVSAPDIESCTALLTVIRAPALRTLDLQCSTSCSPPVIHRCFEVIQSFKSLQSLRMWADRVACGSYHHRPCTIPSHTMRLLYPLHELQDIRIEEHLKLDLHDENALEMAKAWPNLRKLVLTAFTGAYDEEYFPQLTTEALLHFAKYCPNLCQLGLAFDTSFLDMEILDGLKAQDVGQHLRVLEVHPPLAEVENPSEVALFLNRVFPNLQSVRFGDNKLAMSQGWLLVSTFLTTVSCSA